jgi:hypothetical protein
MIRAQRPVSHHPDAQHRMALLQSEAAEKPHPVDDEKEVTVRSGGPGQPPRPQERCRKRGRIHQPIPLRGPAVKAGGVDQVRRSRHQLCPRDDR